MKFVAFPASRINKLRAAAMESGQVPDDLPEGWSKSTIDPAAVVTAFKNLRVRPQFVLRAYQFNSGSNGNGIVWAMPVESEFPGPEDCPKLADRFLNPPRPPSADENFMTAVDGDRSPFSYLCASVLQRELSEFGAMWHGCRWSTHTILGSDPFAQNSRQDWPLDLAVTPMEDWYWKEFCPSRWRPRVEQQTNGTVVVTFLTFSGLGQQRLVRHVDTYRLGTYCFTSDEKVLATGPGGYVF